MLNIWNDLQGISSIRKHLSSEFEIEDLGKLKYFLGMEAGMTVDGMNISQRRYILDLL